MISGDGDEIVLPTLQIGCLHVDDVARGPLKGALPLMSQMYPITNLLLLSYAWEAEISLRIRSVATLCQAGSCPGSGPHSHHRTGPS